MPIQYLDPPVIGNTIQYLDDGSSSPIPQPSDSIYSATKKAIQSRPELSAYGGFNVPRMSGGPVNQAIDAATQTLAAPIRIGQTISKAPDVTGQAVEQIGADTGYPTTGKIVGTAIKYAPMVYGASQTGNALRTSGVPILEGMATSPEELGPRFQAGEKAAGISGDLPIRSGLKTRFPNLAGQPSNAPPAQAPLVPPSSYPRNTSAFLNFANARVGAFGNKLAPQELDDYKTILGTMLRDNSEIVPGTEPYAIAAKLQKNVTALHNEVVPGREELNKVYSWAKTFHPELADPLINMGKKYGKYVLYGALAKLGFTELGH